MKDMNKIKQYIVECACGGGKSMNPHSYMAKPQLAKIANYSSKLHQMVPDDHPLEDWMESKIAQIADDIGEVYHRLDYEGAASPEQQFDEELDPVGKEDSDINNDGAVDDEDAYLHHRRNVIAQHMDESDDGQKLCKRGKEAAKAKYDTYPSAYANGYAVQVCKGQKPDKSGKTKKSKGW